MERKFNEYEDKKDPFEENKLHVIQSIDKLLAKDNIDKQDILEFIHNYKNFFSTGIFENLSKDSREMVSARLSFEKDTGDFNSGDINRIVKAFLRRIRYCLTSSSSDLNFPDDLKLAAFYEYNALIDFVEKDFDRLKLESFEQQKNNLIDSLDSFLQGNVNVRDFLNSDLWLSLRGFFDNYLRFQNIENVIGKKQTKVYLSYSDKELKIFQKKNPDKILEVLLSKLKQLLENLSKDDVNSFNLCFNIYSEIKKFLSKYEIDKDDQVEQGLDRGREEQDTSESDLSKIRASFKDSSPQTSPNFEQGKEQVTLDKQKLQDILSDFIEYLSHHKEIKDIIREGLFINFDFSQINKKFSEYLRQNVDSLSFAEFNTPRGNEDLFNLEPSKNAVEDILKGRPELELFKSKVDRKILEAYLDTLKSMFIILVDIVNMLKNGEFDESLVYSKLVEFRSLFELSLIQKNVIELEVGFRKNIKEIFNSIKDILTGSAKFIWYSFNSFMGSLLYFVIPPASKRDLDLLLDLYKGSFKSVYEFLRGFISLPYHTLSAIYNRIKKSKLSTQEGKK